MVAGSVRETSHVKKCVSKERMESDRNKNILQIHNHETKVFKEGVDTLDN